MGSSVQDEMDLKNVYRLAAEKVGAAMSEYPIRHHAPKLPIVSRGEEIRQWCWDEHVDCIRVGTFWFFRNEEDRILFVMRWE